MFDLKQVEPPQMSKKMLYLTAGGCMLFFLLVIGALGDEDMSESTETDVAQTAGTESKKVAKVRKVTVKCTHVDDSFEVTCADNAPCPKDNSKTLCVHEYVPFWVNGKKNSINNWEKNGHWGQKKDKLTFLNFEVSPRSSISARGTWVGQSSSSKSKVKGFGASAHGTIYFVGAPDVIKGVGSQLYGVGRFREFDQGFVSDDLYVEIVAVLSRADYEKYNALQAFSTALSKDSSPSGEQADVTYTHYEDASKRAKKYELEYLFKEHGGSVEGLKTAATAHRTAERGRLSAKLKDSAYERIRHLSFEWDSVNGDNVLEEDWALSSKKKCRNKPSNEGKKSRKAEYVKAITSPIFRVDIRFEDPKFKKSKKGFVVPYYASDFSLSGKLKHKRESDSMVVCCHIFSKQCDETPGILSNRCPRGYVKRRQSMGSSYDWRDPGRLKFVLPADSKDQELKRLKGEALVQIKSKHYVCSKDGVELSKYKGVLHGVRITHGDQTVEEIANLDLSVDDALKGSRAWLAGRIKGAAPAKKTSKKKKRKKK